MPPPRDSSNGRLNKHLLISPVCQAVGPQRCSSGRYSCWRDVLCGSFQAAGGVKWSPGTFPFGCHRDG